MPTKNEKNSIRVLLAESPTAEHYQNEQALSRCDSVLLLPCVSDGADVIRVVKSGNVDLLLLDLLITGIDGISVLRELQDIPESQQPVIILLTAIRSELIINEAIRLGAVYSLLKPLDTRVMTQRVVDIYRTIKSTDVADAESALARNELRSSTASFLREVGVPPHLLGYKFLLYTIEICVGDGGFRQGITTSLYPAVATLCHSSPQKVERSIRHAIEATWQRNDPIHIQRILGMRDDAVERPTNSEFIACCTEILLERDRHKGVFSQFHTA